MRLVTFNKKQQKEILQGVHEKRLKKLHIQYINMDRHKKYGYKKQIQRCLLIRFLLVHADITKYSICTLNLIHLY
jgi:hypothetical protein